MRTCSDTKFTRHERLGRPCLLYDIDRCSGPCVGAVDHAAYDGYVNDLMGFLSGDTEPVLARLEAEMLDGQRGAAVRAGRPPARPDRRRPQGRRVPADGLGPGRGLRRGGPGRGPAGGVGADLPRAAGPRGRAPGLRGREGGGPLGARVHGAGRARRSTGPTAPRCRAACWCPRSRPTAQLLQSWLHTIRGGPVDIAVPQRGAKRALQETVTRSAGEDLARHRLRRAADHNARSKALTELQSALSLREAPLRIECYDMSHLQGTDYVGSMVVFEDGLAKRSDYRRFKVKSVPGNDDYAAMEEVLTRRLTALKQPTEVPADGRPRRFAYRPNLIVVDGGKGQLGVAERVVRELGLEDEVELASLAKQFEEVYRPGFARPGAPAPGLRRPLPAAAAARRGPPLRHHLPPGAPGQADDHAACSTTSRAWGRPARPAWSRRWAG